jgi:hypothetical protein
MESKSKNRAERVRAPVGLASSLSPQISPKRTLWSGGASFDTRTGARSSGSARFHLTIIAQSWSFALRFMGTQSELVPAE